MTQIVLLVDDDRDDRTMTLRVLRKSRFDVECIERESGQTALEFLENCARLPAVILMDLKMPGMNGIDTLLRMRADRRLCHLPVVIMTNSILESDSAAAMNAGADAFLRKAMDLGRHASDIGTLLERWVKDTKEPT